MRSIWSRLGISRPHTIRKQRGPQQAKLLLERLEDRCMLSTTVSLDAAGNLVIDDTGGGNSNDNITIKSDTTNSQFVISDPANTIATSIAGASGSGTNVVLVPFGSVSGSEIVVNTLAGDDFLTVDLGLGNFAKTIAFNGGANGVSGDELRLQGGGAFANVTHTHASASSGSVLVTGNALISYSGLEPVTDNLSATDRVFAFSGGDDLIVMNDVAGAPYMSVDSNFGVLVRFFSPTNSLTINAGAGIDTVGFSGVDGAFAATLIIDGGAENDTINIRPVNSTFNGSLNIHGGTGDDTVNLINDMTFAANRNLEVNLQDDAVPVGFDRIFVQTTANYVFSGAGMATLKASGSVSLAVSSSIITADGDLIVEANQQVAPAATMGFTGITVDGATLQSTGSGAVQVLGRGGAAGSNNIGVLIALSPNGNIPGIVRSGTGPLQVAGAGGSSSSSPNSGVTVTGAGSLIGSAGGNVQVTGTGGGTGSSSGNNGVTVNIGQISAGGTGAVTVLGTAGTGSGGPNRGVQITGGTITSAGGNVQVTGVGGANPASQTNGTNYGVWLATSGTPGVISAGGAGTVTVHGTGSLAGGVNNHGVFVAGTNSRITSGGGNIQVTGIQGATGTASTGLAFGISLTSNGSVTSVGAANIELISDSMNFVGTAAVVAGGTNTVTLRQRTNGTAISTNVADSAGILGLTDAEINRVTASVLNIGDINSGLITVSGTVSPGTPTVTNLTTGSDISLLGLFADSNAVVNLNAPTGSITTPPGSSATAPDVRAATVNVDGVAAPGGASAGEFAVDGSLVFSSTDRYRAQLNGASAFSQYDVISVTGTADLGDATLEVLPTFTPSIGQLFTIVNTSGGVTGTFRDTGGNPLSDGATFNANGITFSITYQGGSDGLDVVLRAQTTGLTIFISDASAVETNDGATTITFNVNMSAPGNQTIAVNWATANGTGTMADSDYVGASGTVAFAAGDTSEQVTITVNGDVKFELDETFVVNLSNAVGAIIGDNQGVGTILNDDNRPTASIDDVTASEGTFVTTDLIFTVSLSNPTAETVFINYQTFDGSATAGDGDYFPDSGTLTFAPGETIKTLAVGINADDKFEQDDSFTVLIAVGSEVTLADDTGVGNILNDDATPRITINDLGIFEGDSGTNNLTFPVLLSNPSYLPITVDFATADGTATSVDNDYQSAAGTLTFTPGQTAKTVTVLVNGDTKLEPNQSLTLNLSNSTNAAIADPTGMGTIHNDDSQPTISINDVTVTEGDAGSVNATFNVSMSNASDQTITVNAATADSSALAPEDYTSVSSTLVSFAPGQTAQIFTVQVHGDLLNEIDEMFFVNLTSPSNATILDDQAVGTIVTDDFVPVAAAGPDQTAYEGDMLSFDGIASSDLNGDPLTYSWSFGDGSGQAAGRVVTHAYANDGTYSVTLTVSDGHGGSSSDTLVVTVRVPPPAASLSGPSNGVRGQTRAFTITVDGEPTVQTTIAWGDGATHPTLTGPQNISLNHVYVATGTYTVTLTARNPDGATTVRSHNLTIAVAEMQGTTFAVGGTTANDSITVEPTNTAGTSIRTIVNDTAFGPFTPVSLVVFGQAGADSIVLRSITTGSGKSKTTSYVAVPATLFGDAGADFLDASGSNVGNVLSGGDDNDQLLGGTARDLFFGGLGADILRGGGGDDLLVGNPTVFDNDLVALNALRAEWTRSDLGYAARIDHLLGRTTGGLNGSYRFNRTTVLGETFIDQLYGEGNQDWFLVLESEAGRDSVKDRKNNETITRL